MTLDELIKELKVFDQLDVLNQLGILGDLVSKTREDEDYRLTEQGVKKKRWL